jgi:hypothetical protein
MPAATAACHPGTGTATMARQQQTPQQQAVLQQVLLLLLLTCMVIAVAKTYTLGLLIR